METWTASFGLEQHRVQKVRPFHLLITQRLKLITLFSAVFWTGASFSLNGKDKKRSLLEAEPRLHDVRGRIRSMGTMAATIQPFWCAIHSGRCLGGAGLA